MLFSTVSHSCVDYPLRMHRGGKVGLGTCVYMCVYVKSEWGLAADSHYEVLADSFYLFTE